MTVDELVQIRTQIQDASTRHAASRAAAEKVRDDLKAGGANFASDKDAFDKVDVAFRESDGLRDEITELRTRESRLMEIMGQKVADRKSSDEAKAHDVRRLGDRLANSNEYRALVASRSLEMAQARVHMDPVEIATREEFIDGLRLRTTVDNTSGSGGGLIWSDRTGIVVQKPTRSVRLLDALTLGDTDTDTVEWARETTVTDSAAPTAYGTAAPESAYGWTKASTTVKRIPHFVPATKGSLADGGQLRTLLESRLMRGLRLTMESQAWSGDGTGENLTGITATGVITNTQALGSDTRFDAVHKAITKVRLALFDEPSAIAIHPTDYEKVVLEKDADGNYVHGRGPTESSVATIWGLTPIVTSLVSVGSPMVADFSYATMWLRAGVSVAASDSHNDFFLKGLVAILAECRAAFAVLESKAFCGLTGF